MGNNFYIKCKCCNAILRHIGKNCASKNKSVLISNYETFLALSFDYGTFETAIIVDDYDNEYTIADLRDLFIVMEYTGGDPKKTDSWS